VNDDHLKVLDGRRKAVLLLPNAAFKLWHCHWMAEDGERESFLSIEAIMEQTGMGENTIVRATKLLVKGGWLVDTGRRAADKWIAMGKTPTSFSYQVHVYRVEDPTTAKMEEVADGTPAKMEDKVSLVVSSGVGSGVGVLPSPSVGVALSSTPPPAAEPLLESQKIEGEAITKTSTQTKTNPHGRKTLAPDGTTWKEWDAHDLPWKNAKMVELGLMEWKSVPSGRGEGIHTGRIPEKGEPYLTDEEIEAQVKALMDDPLYPHPCSSGDFGCLDCEPDNGVHKVGDGYLCTPCWSEEKKDAAQTRVVENARAARQVGIAEKAQAATD
jgi:hypothetical protein